LDWNNFKKYFSDMESKSKIIITRKAEWLNRLRAYRVFIDGIESGKVSNGSSEEFVTDAGVRKVQCKVNWYGSREFEVQTNPGEVSYLRVKSGMKFFWIFYILLIGGLGFNLFYRFANIKKPGYATNVELALILPAILYLLYYITFGRKDYLIVSKDSKNFFA
jgi:hypothetical protein